MGRYSQGTQLFGFENSDCTGFGSEVDSIDKKQIPWGFFNNRLDIIFRYSAGIYYLSADFRMLELLTNKRPHSIITFKWISNTEDNSPGAA